jgi:hypothetical protein
MDLRLGVNSKTIVQNAAGAATSPVTPAGPPAGTPPPAAGGPLDPISKILKSRHLATILGLLNLGTGNPLAIVNSVLDIVKAVAGIAGQGVTDVSLSPEDEAFLKANAQELVDALQTEKEKLDQANLAQSQAASAQAAAEKDRHNRHIDWQIQQLQQQRQP